MTSMGQACPLCNSQLLKFLFNADGDFIINCSSRVCLYGVLHAQIYKADSRPVISGRMIDDLDHDRHFFDSLQGIDEEDIHKSVASSSVHNRTDDHTAKNTHEPFTTQSGSPLNLDGFQEYCQRVPTKDDDMINQWVQELMDAPKESTQAPAENLPEVTLLPKRSSTKRTPVVPVVRKNTSLVPKSRGKSKAPSVRSVSSDSSDAPKQTKCRTVSGKLKKSQALSTLLKANVGVSPVTPDDSRSEVSSESGIQSDSSDRSVSSLTPIQRLLHIEEAKKRSWGATGMPGFQPSATTLRRKQAFSCEST